MAGPTLEREATASTPRSLGSTQGGRSLTGSTTIYRKDLQVLPSARFRLHLRVRASEIHCALIFANKAKAYAFIRTAC